MPPDFAKMQRQKISAALRQHLLAAHGGSLPFGVDNEIVMGQVASLRAQGDDGDWVVGDLMDEGSGIRIPFVGQGLGSMQIGQAVRLTGSWREHREYGLQFVATMVQQHLPTTTDGISRWLAHNVPGCGPGSAGKLIARWGEKTLEHLLAEPSAVREVLGGKSGARVENGLREAQSAGEKVASERSVSVRLLGAGFTPNQIARLLRHFKGAEAVERVVLTRPYDLTQVGGIGFLTADRLARGMGVSTRDPMRLAAGAVHVVLEAQGQGDSLLPESEVLKRASRALGIDDHALLQVALQQAEQAGTLVRREEQALDEMPRRWMTKDAFVAEERVAAWVVSMLQRPRAPEESTADLIARESATYGLTATQAEAVTMAIREPLSILTGLPGAGKTTTVRVICRVAEALGRTIAIAAPTGKAAARAQEVTGVPASTIHRLLIAAEKNQEPLDVDILVVDEVSMQDVALLSRLARVVDGDVTRVLLVGDYNQLPSVAHGQVLRDLLQIDRVPRVRLTEILRQESKDSVGVSNSHRLLAGKPLMVNNSPESDFWFADITDDGEVDENGWPRVDDEDRSRREQQAAQDRIVNAVNFLMKHDDVIAARDIQILTPMKSRGPLGAEALNEVLQRTINPDGVPGPKVGGKMVAHIGDRLMQVDRNNYDVDGFLCNGEQGVVTSVGKDCLTLDLGDRAVELKGAHLHNLRHAWAITTHRSQGSEFRFVITPLHTSHFVMLRDPSLFYTALTRFKSRIIVVGSQRMLGLLEKFSRRPVLRGTGLVEAIDTRLQLLDRGEPVDLPQSVGRR